MRDHDAPLTESVLADLQLLAPHYRVQEVPGQKVPAPVPPPGRLRHRRRPLSHIPEATSAAKKRVDVALAA